MNNIYTKKRAVFLGKTTWSFFFTLLGLDYLFLEIYTENKWGFLFFLLLISFVSAGIWTYISICRKNKNLKIERENLNLNIIRGNIFKQNNSDNLIIIPVDSEFKNHNYTNNNPIAKTTVQSQFMRSIYNKTEKVSRKKDYELYSYKKQCFVPFEIGKLDDDNRVDLELIGNYFYLIHRLCNLIDEIERNEEIIIPVIGGRVRFTKETNALSAQQRLELLITALKMYKFEQKVKIKIVIFSKTEEDYKFDEL